LLLTPHALACTPMMEGCDVFPETMTVLVLADVAGLDG
jgi:hypothetical protein